MFRAPLSILLFCACLTTVRGQLPIRYFELTPEKSSGKVPHSLYGHIEFADSRKDSAMIGIVQAGPFNNIDTRLVFRTPVRPQLQQLLSAMIDSTAGDGTLLFQLRNFSFVETWGSRYFVIKATLYAKKGESYQKLSTLDKHVVVRNPIVLYVLPGLANTVVNAYLDSALSRTAADGDQFSLQEIASIDSLETNRLPVYGTDRYTDGVYLSYSSFCKQLPDMPGSIKARKGGQPTSVTVRDDSGNEVRLSPKDAYAVVYRSKAYIATPFGYYPLEKVRGNLFFTGDIFIAEKVHELKPGEFTYGLLGDIENGIGSRKTYDILIDPENGLFIHLREVPKSDSP